MLISIIFNHMLSLHIFSSLLITLAHLNIPLVLCLSAGVFGTFSFRLFTCTYTNGKYGSSLSTCGFFAVRDFLLFIYIHIYIKYTCI